MNSCTEVERAIPQGELESLAGMGCAAAAEPMNGVAFAKARPWVQPETILLVEDETFVRKVTAEVLESAGYRLVIATSAAEALEAYRGCSDRFDLLLADVVLPGMSGPELATEFTSMCPSIRVLLMSGYAEQLARCALLDHGRCLAKPFSTHMLLQRVREALDANPFDLGPQA